MFSVQREIPYLIFPRCKILGLQRWHLEGWLPWHCQMWQNRGLVWLSLAEQRKFQICPLQNQTQCRMSDWLLVLTKRNHGTVETQLWTEKKIKTIQSMIIFKYLSLLNTDLTKLKETIHWHSKYRAAFRTYNNCIGHIRQCSLLLFPSAYDNEVFCWSLMHMTM